MPLDSLQSYCAAIAQETVLPASVPGTLAVYVTPPSREKLTGPRVYVWGGRTRETRQTAPRGMGFKKLQWQVDLWLSFMDSAADAAENEPFAKFIDAVMAAFRTTVMPVIIDPTGNVVDAGQASSACSQVLSVGEDMDLDYPPERSTGKQQVLWYQAHLGVSVMEAVQG